MTTTVMLNKEDLKRLVLEEIKKRLGDLPFDMATIKIETRSKQNFKSEWEDADFRAAAIIDV